MTDATGNDTPDLVLGADEIVNYPLRKVTRGYAVKDVDDLLDQLAVQTQDLLQHLGRVAAERDQLRDELSEANEAESMLKRTLVTAQRAAEASVAEAREEADRMRARASERIEEMLADAAQQAHRLREAALRRARADEADIRRHRRDIEEHIEQLRTFASDHRARIAHHLELQQERLSEMTLPDPPPEPSYVRDDVLEDDLPTVDVETFMAELDEDPASADATPPTDATPPEDADRTETLFEP